jgi:hypothetical protein
LDPIQQPKLNLADHMPEHEWQMHRLIIDEASTRDLPFALGGGLAFSTYSGRWRNTKDLDLFVLPRDREAFIDIAGQQGFTDYFDQKEYDRSWIYRAFREDVIVDLIWTMPNHRTEVDDAWVHCGRRVDVRGICLRLLPVEELLWSKLYVMQRDRCDWPDLMNVLYAAGPEMDWNRLIDRLGPDIPLLSGLVSIFGWLCPERAREFPGWVWMRLGAPRPLASVDCDGRSDRSPLLDTRDWFGPNQIA